MSYHEKKWYQILGISFAVAIAALSIGIGRVRADQLVSTDSVAHSPAWYNGASISNKLGLQGEATLDVEVAISIPVERGSPYSQTIVLNVYSDSGYTSSILATSTSASIVADGAKKMVTYHFGTIPAGYWMLSVYSDGGDVYGSCTAGTNDGGTNLSCTPSTDGVAYYSGVGGGGTTPTITQFVSFNPADATISTTTFPLSATYWASSTPDLGYADLVPTYLQVNVYREDNGYNLIYNATTTITTYGSTQTWTPTSTMDLPTGSYQAQWTMYDQSGNYILITRNVRFAMNENPWPWLIGATSTNAADLSGLATSTCDYLHLQGCFQNALVWAFVPSAESMQNLARAGDQIMLAPPVGYVTQYRLAFASTSASGTPPWVVPLPTSSALYTQLVQPLRTGVAAVLILVLCFSMYRQIRTPLDL